MKKIMILVILTVGSLSFAESWTEDVECSIARVSVDDGSVVTERSAAILGMSGPHNGSTGNVEVSSALTPSYSIVFEKISGGRTEEAYLTTKIGERVVAKSSNDQMQSSFVVNQFMSLGGDYQISISCTSEVNESSIR